MGGFLFNQSDFSRHRLTACLHANQIGAGGKAIGIPSQRMLPGGLLAAEQFGNTPSGNIENDSLNL